MTPGFNIRLITLCGRYARALFEALDSEISQENVYHAFYSLNEYFKKNTKNFKLLCNGLLSLKQRLSFFSDLAERFSFDLVFKKFLKMLTTSNRLNLFKEIFTLFQELYFEKKQHHHFHILLATEPNFLYINKIENYLKKIFNLSSLTLCIEEDPNLILGIQISNKRYTIAANLKNDLSKLELLLKHP
jgi:ATP synthase F1 delta subunit